MKFETDIIPAWVRGIMERLEENGCRVWLVGGCLRDMVRGLKPHDWDMAGTARPECVSEIFECTAPTGIKHGTVTIITDGGTVEHTTLRREGDYSDGRHPDTVSFTDRLEDDLVRRDFTMNALAMDVHGELTDLFGGLKDISDGVIRCVGEPERRFSEDALRILRALRFSAQTGFEIETLAEAAMVRLAPLTAALAAERVRAEIEGIICSDRAEMVRRAFNIGAVFGHMTGDGSLDGRLNMLPLIPSVRWCGLCALIDEDAADFLRKLRLDAETVKHCSTAEKVKDLTDNKTVKYEISVYGETAVRHAAARQAVLGDDGVLERVQRIIISGECCNLRGLAIDGAELKRLGFAGKEIGAVLRTLLDYVIEHPKENNPQRLGELAGVLRASWQI